ncbi:hypothetical protein [Winogradskyella psychrotolerans]|uniref:hypothetical protein n=1 Tax=Winogradskyella psychrotolerans TaxID=1344585 RepID=UPI001C066B64|nr:hypothetical protein [Winogradskyella psychrotolerans]MBU2929985.1 hypothetical protein [Winogradskyella psychrotolerans]
MGNNIEKLPLKKRIISGITSGLLYALLMAGYDYFTDVPFSILKFILHSVFFGLVMSYAFRYKVTKNKE